ncbi:branched-chain amino acid aminotransferase group II [Bradyrhizobium sp. USDA 223]
MSMTFDIQPASNPTPEKDRVAKLVDPGFGRIFTDHMAIVRYNQAKGGWYEAKIEARANFQLDPAGAVLHYAQEIFEGLKAYKRDDGGVNLFRPDANARRFKDSADRMAMAQLPEDVFIEAVEQVVRIDRAWMPGGEGSLYLRPFMIASETFLGVKPSSEYIFAVIASPVGSYFKGGPAPVSIWVSENYTRAAIGGTGAVKCGGNYAASLRAQAEAIQHGCDQVVFLDAVERRYIEELGGMNVFFVFDDGSLSTPPLGTILPGITRDSIITLARDARQDGARRTLYARAVAQGRGLRQAEGSLRLRHRRRDLADRQGALGQRRFRHLRRRRRPRRHGPAQAARRHPVRPHQRSPQLDPQGVLITLQGRVKSATFVAYCALNVLLPTCDKARTQQAFRTSRSWQQSSPNP